MTKKTRELMRVLSEEFGVDADFAEQLTPLLDLCAEHQDTAEGRAAILGCVAGAFRRSQGVATTGVREEVGVLIREFRAELRKVDESLKVLLAFLSRIRKHVDPPPSSRTVH